PQLAQFGYAACLPFGREPDAQGRAGLWLDIADKDVPDDIALNALRAELGLEAAAVLDYRDPRTGVQRALRVARDAAGAQWLQGFWVAGGDAADAALAAWWRETLQGDAPLAMPAHRLLAPGAREGRADAAPASPQLCTCFNVSVAQVTDALAAASGDAGARLAQAQDRLRCGTNCGSCLPRLRGLAQQACQHDAASIATP
ncbi:MAG: bacterioferritin-associated ferredoxin, partial [Burkholderiaceae bacterium]